MYAGVPIEVPSWVSVAPDGLRLRRGDGLRDAEVGDDRGPAGEEDVVRLDVAMHDAALVRVGERLGDVAQDVDRGGDRHGPVREPRAQRLPLDERHRVVRQPVDVAGGDDGDDVRLLERRGELDLALEPLGRDRRGELGGEHLHDDLSAEPVLGGDEDARHPAAAELALDRVGAAERVLDALPEIHVHRRRGRGRAGR